MSGVCEKGEIFRRKSVVDRSVVVFLLFSGSALVNGLNGYFYLAINYFLVQNPFFQPHTHTREICLKNKIMSNLHCLHVIREISKFCHREMRNGKWNVTRLLEVVSRGRLYSDLLVHLVGRRHILCNCNEQR